MSQAEMTDARTAPTAVARMVQGLKGEALETWRMADVTGRPSAEARHLDEGFPFGWYGVIYSDELAVGEVKPARYLGRDLVIWRGEDGQARVLDAYCRHLGANLAYGGRVNGNDIECPFHAWRYNETGAVTAIPYAKTVPPQAKRANCVRAYPTIDRNGLVWIWYHPDGIAPLWDIQVFPEVGSADWTPFKKHEWRVFNSLRQMDDNSVDFAHFLYVHGTASFPDSDVEIEGGFKRSVARAKLGTPQGLVDGAIVSESQGPGQGWVKFQGISETLLVNAVTPVEQDELHVRFAFTQPKSEAEGPRAGLARALIRDICKQLDQDKPIWDRQMYLREPLLCDGDGPLVLSRKRLDLFFDADAFRAAEGKKHHFTAAARI